MPNKTSQVQRKQRSEKLLDLPPEVQLAFEKDLKERLEAEGYPVFLKAETGTRDYPGEAEAGYLMGEIEGSPSPKRDKLLKVVQILQDYEESSNSGNPGRLAKAARTMKGVVAELASTIPSGRYFTLGLSRQGLIVRPDTPEGMTAFALLSLFEQRRVSRLRQCLHCRSWFYARFKHQRFCPISVLKCQWNHYHTPEWRRQHREQNRKHQRSYRERTFGKRNRGS